MTATAIETTKWVPVMDGIRCLSPHGVISSFGGAEPVDSEQQRNANRRAYYRAVASKCRDIIFDIDRALRGGPAYRGHGWDPKLYGVPPGNGPEAIKQLRQVIQRAEDAFDLLPE